MYKKTLVVSFFASSFSHQGTIQLLEAFGIFSACIAKVISTITTSCYLNFAVCSEINMTKILPELHQCKGSLKTPIVVSIGLLCGVARSLTFNNEQVLVSIIPIKKLFDFSTCLVKACSVSL